MSQVRLNENTTTTGYCSSELIMSGSPISTAPIQPLVAFMARLISVL
jgi:hypothetical protein